MSEHEHEYEPVPGLPEELPEGEVILWQGAPDWRALARRAFHLRILALYFAALLAFQLSAALWTGAGVASADAARSATAMIALGLCAAALFVLIAWLIARTTLYTITSKRLVMRFGIALPMSVNLPFGHIQAAAVKSWRDGYGDIPVTLDDSHRASYIVMWPHTRPWKFRRPEPMLRGVADAKAVAELLADAANGAAAPAGAPAGGVGGGPAARGYSRAPAPALREAGAT